MTDFVVNNEITKFFNKYFANKNNLNKFIPEIHFLGNLLSNLTSSHDLRNLANTLMTINKHNKNELDYIKHDIKYINDFFQDDDEVIKVLTNDKYIVANHVVRDKYNYIYQFYNISLIKIFINIYSIYDTNYNEYIIKNKELDTLLEIYNTFIQKYNLSNYKLDYNTNYKPINYYNICINTNMRDSKMTYNIYLEFYKTLETYYNNLNYLYNSCKTDDSYKIDTYKIQLPKADPYKIQLPKIDLKNISIEKAESKTEYNPNKLESMPIQNKSKKKAIPHMLKRMVWNYWVGETIGKTKCLCCKTTDITMLTFVCGHIIPESKGGELLVNNLKPICGSCNSSMGTTNMDEYIKKYGKN
jgi:5-methylcytosine-specific restriction endonuclease McrA